MRTQAEHSLAHYLGGFADTPGCWATGVSSAVALRVIRLACKRADSLGLATLCGIA